MFATAGSATIAYDDVGSGPTVVFLHGFPHDRTLWAPQTSALATRVRCVAPDLRGFGGSTLGCESDGPVSMDRYADDVVEVLDAAGVERAVVVGLSMGGYVSFALWRRHRDRVRALVLASTRAAADGDEVRARRHALIETAREVGSEAVADAQIGGSVSRRTREHRPELVGAVHHMLARAPADAIVAALEAMLARPDSTPDLARIDVPCLVVAGTDDVVVHPREARLMHEAVPGSRLELLAGTGHLCNAERPGAFNHVLAEFIASLPPA